MGEKEYQVVGPRKVAGHSTGDKFAYAYPPVLEKALVDGGHLKVLSKPEPLRCPACQETGKAADKKKAYQSAEELAAHYKADHPALAPPEREE